MKAIFYKRHQASGIHVHYSFMATCCYIPEWNVILAVESTGSFQKAAPCYTDDAFMLEEAKNVALGILPHPRSPQIICSGMSFHDVQPPPNVTDVRHAEVDESLAREAFIEVKAMKSAREKADKLMADLFKVAK